MSDAIYYAVYLAMQAVQNNDLPDGIARLLAFVDLKYPKSKDYAKIRKVDFAADAAAIRDALEKVLPGDDSAELYFGLDSLNMPNGKGIEFGAGDVNSCYPNARAVLPSAAFGQIFRYAKDTDAQYALAIGYLGLAIKTAFATIPPRKALGKTRKRTIIFGFHDGDLFPLGQITLKGLTLKLNKSLLKAPPAPPPLPKIDQWPGPQSTAIQWHVLAARFARAIANPTENARWTNFSIESLCDCGAFAEAEPFVRELLPLVPQIKDESVKHDVYIRAAYTSAGLGRQEEARAFLEKAMAIVETYGDFWKEHGEDDVKQCAADLGLSKALKVEAVPPSRKYPLLARAARRPLKADVPFIMEEEDVERILLARPRRITDFDAALALARKLRSDGRHRAIARIYIRARRWADLHKFLGTLQDPQVVRDVCVGITWEYPDK